MALPCYIGGANFMLDKEITLYHYENGAYTKQVISNTFYYDVDITTVSKMGSQTNITFIVIINTNTDIDISTGKDIVVKGKSDFEFDNTSESTIAKSLKELKEQSRIYTIKGVDRNLFGGLSNIKLSCI